jgi:2-succinyl-5-enolpyruvyl-6-hydroxy-3-cyclohexene-1-carboxylate synthase
LRFSTEFSEKALSLIRDKDERLVIEKKILLDKFPLSEQSLCFKLSQAVGSDPVYLGNSLPIRHWDQFAVCNSSVFAANRGANGIDGQVSTYLGWSEQFQNSFCVVGDLTAMYDLASLGLTPQLNGNSRNLVVINNFGGQIFNRVFKNNDFINAHDRQFFHWAQMWNWNYIKVQEPSQFSELQKATEGRRLIEVVPDSAQTAQFWNEWDQLWQNP